MTVLCDSVCSTQCNLFMFLLSVVCFLRPYHVCVSLYHRMILGSEQLPLGKDVFGKDVLPVAGRVG